jgi:hypothetical protein
MADQLRREAGCNVFCSRHHTSRQAAPSADPQRRNRLGEVAGLRLDNPAARERGVEEVRNFSSERLAVRVARRLRNDAISMTRTIAETKDCRGSGVQVYVAACARQDECLLLFR